MKRTLLLVACLLLTSMAHGYTGGNAFTRGLTEASRVAFAGDSWVSVHEMPTSPGGANYALWESEDNLSQSADWAWKVCRDVGWRNYRVFATGGQSLHSSTGISVLNTPDMVAWKPDITFILAGINSCGGADLDAANTQGLLLADSLQSMIDRLQAVGSKVVICELKGVSSCSGWSVEADCTRSVVNTWINGLTEDANLLVHSDSWLHDSTGTYWADSGTPGVEKINIASPYGNADGLHLLTKYQYWWGDSLWVNTLDSFTTDGAGVSQTYYVDVATGDDWENTGLTALTPLKTLSGALCRAGAGDSVSMVAGEYDLMTDSTSALFDNNAFSIMRTGSSAAPIYVDGNGSTFTCNYPDAEDDEAGYYLYGSEELGAHRWDSCHVVLHDLDFYDYYYALRMDSDGLDIHLDECGFYGSGINVGDGVFALSTSCIYQIDATYNTGRLNYIGSAGCDSLVYIDTFFNMEAGTSGYCFYSYITAPADDAVFRFLNCHFYSPGSMRFFQMSNDLTSVWEMDNCTMTCGSNYGIFLPGTLDFDCDNNFLDAAIYAGGILTLGEWITLSTGANQWDYLPAAGTDTLTYGGIAPTNDYAQYLDIPHTQTWCSIGTMTQADIPTIGVDYPRLADADSLLYVPTWAEGDVIIYQHDATIEGIAQRDYEILRYVENGSDTLFIVSSADEAVRYAR